MYDDVILTEKNVKLRKFLNNKLGRVRNETTTDLSEGRLFFQNFSHQSLTEILCFFHSINSVVE
jgi:hypothetical protein